MNLRRLLLVAGAVCLAALLPAALGLALWRGSMQGPPPPRGWEMGDRMVKAGDGSGLGRLAHPRQRSGPWIGAGEIPSLVEAAALAAEDRRFFQHPGVDPLAVLGAAARNLRAGRVVSGGSTLTMQLCRLLDPGPRNLSSKLRETSRALWLETRLSKKEILAQYLNRAPFGGGLVGLGAGAWVLLGKPPSALAPEEAALLLALPQNPARFLQADQRDRLLERRNRVLGAMAQAGALNPAALGRALEAPIELLPPPPPHPAPHFLAALRSRAPAGEGQELQTDLDPDLQASVLRLVRTHLSRLGGDDAAQAAVLVLRNRDLAVLAWLGSPDWDQPLFGQVDGVLASRQPGSALKPFIYALALEAGRTLADPVEDDPLELMIGPGVFRPGDYDGRTRGSVPLKTALASSLNLPAMRMVEEMGVERALRGLRSLGLALPRPAEEYGLGLALGDGEVSLLELTTAYAALARGGIWQPARLWRDQERSEPLLVLDPAAARLITQALSEDPPRAPGFGRHGMLELPFPAAAKTGTSQKHRDTWCLGYTSEYTVGVWVGHFSGRSLPGLTGSGGAGPIWRSVMLHLHRRTPGSLPPWPPGIETRRVCAESGRPAGPLCPHPVEEYFASAHPPEGLCPLHPARQAAGVMPAAPAGLPPGISGIRITTPLAGAEFALDPDLPRESQVLHCQARVGGEGREDEKVSAQWRLNGRLLSGGPEPLALRLPLTPGRHVLEVRARGFGEGGGETGDRVSFLVRP